MNSSISPLHYPPSPKFDKNIPHPDKYKNNISPGLQNESLSGGTENLPPLQLQSCKKREKELQIQSQEDGHPTYDLHTPAQNNLKLNKILPDINTELGKEPDSQENKQKSSQIKER